MDGARRVLSGLAATALLIGACGGPSASPTSPLAGATATPGLPSRPPATTAATPAATPPADATSPPSAPPATASAAPEPTATTPTTPALTGDGVTVAIVDRGIDFTHPDFLNPDGTTRIRAIYDMTGPANWCNDPGPAVEYTEEQINAALRGEADIDHRDAVGHGTATAGLAAGNGSALANRLYAGVAPEADLVVVKVTSEGAPAHGGVAEEAPFNACIDDALDWLDAKIDEIGQPAVAIWNAGTQWGPIDGTSATSRKINEVFPPDRPGRVWVATSGDEGGIPNHARADFGPGSPAVIGFDLTGDSYPSAWYSGDARVNVTIELADGTSVGPVGPGETLDEDGITVTQYRPGEEFDPWQSTSGDRAVWMRIVGHAGQSGTIEFASGDGSGRVDLYGDVLGPTPLTSAIEFTDSLAEGRINDVSSTEGVIVTGVHVALDQFIDIDGATRSFAAEGFTGDLWYRSSNGSTRDGRDVVDITAAGQNVPASLAADSWWSDPSFRQLWPQSGEGRYIRFGGTSAAGPIVTGTVALMLQANPALTTNDIREILHRTAIADEFTGEVPNPDWGYGKLDIAAAVEAATE